MELDMSLYLKKLKTRRLVFAMIVFAIIIGTAFSFIVFTLPALFHMNEMESSVQVGLCIYVLMVLIEIICGVIGLYELFLDDKDNLYLMVNLQIQLFYYKINGIQFAPSVLNLGMDFGFNNLSIGVNVISIILIIWYKNLRQQKITYTKLAEEKTL